MSARRRGGPSGRIGFGLALGAIGAAAAVAVANGGWAVVAVGPSRALFAGGLLVLGGAVFALDRLPRRLDLVLVGALALLAEQVLVTEPGIPWGHDARLHVWAAAAWTEELLQGVPFPFWLHPLGAGVPLPQFYPPLAFAPLVLLHAAGLALETAFRWTFVLFALTGTLGVWCLVRRVTPDRRAALVAAAVPAADRSRRLSTGLADAFIEYSNRRVFAQRPRAWGRLGVGLVVRRDGSPHRLARARSYASWRAPAATGSRPSSQRRLDARARHGRIRVEAPAAGTVRIREQCFPGWREGRGGAWVEARCDGDGFLTATVDRARTVEWRSDPWRAPRIAGFGVSVSALAVALTGWWVRKSSRTATPRAAP